HRWGPDPFPLPIRATREGPNLGKALPHDVQGPAANDLAVVNAFGDPELLYVLVQGDRGLAEQSPGTDVVVDQPADRPHIPGPRTSDRILHRPHTLARDGSRPGHPPTAFPLSLPAVPPPTRLP